MEKILWIAHTESDGSLGKGAREALSAAIELHGRLQGSELSVGLWGGEVKAAADSIAGCGARSFFGVEGASFSPGRYASDVSAAEALARAASATVVIAPTTSRTSRALPGIAPRLGARIDTHVVGLETGESGPRIQRWYYRQRMVATLARSHRPWILVVDPGIASPASLPGGSAPLEALAVDLVEEKMRTRVEGEVAATSSAKTIRPDAELLFVAGAGWTKKQADGETHVKEAESLIRNFLEASRASLGGSKSLVEQGGEGEAVLAFMTHLNQVGQTGASPRHPKGLSTCCHGEEPHVVGWRFINERRAINKDASCGWAQGKADVVYVADAFEVMAKVNELLGKG